MSDLPILFSAPMVRAILREIDQPGIGKTQTRRVLDAWCDEPPAIAYDGRIITYDDGEREYRWPRTYAIGDRLYVREAWAARMTHGWTVADARSRHYQEHILFRADDEDCIDGWWPSIHMPREFSRITLIVTDVRVQRLQEISSGDATAEGVERDSDGWHDYQMPGTQCCANARASFRTLWDSLNAVRGYGWDANPWVATYTFRPILGNIDQISTSPLNPET